MKKKAGHPDWGEVDTTADKQQSFVFTSGSLALDLVMMRGKNGDLLVTPQDVARWRTMAHAQDSIIGRQKSCLKYKVGITSICSVVPAQKRLPERNLSGSLIVCVPDGIPVSS